ncbi:MAG: hypothetical protein ACPGXK_07355 [Phycisphaerae bacterium]
MPIRSSVRYVAEFLFLGTLFLLQSGCSDKPDVTASTEDGPTSASKQPGHWVQDEEIRSIMSGLVFETPWPSRDDDPENTSEKSRREALANAQKLAKALQAAAGRIPGIVEPESLHEADYRGFVAHASTLADQAERLEKLAKNRKIEEMQRLLDEIDLTCIACHSRYRDISGYLAPRQADRGPKGILWKLAGYQG